VLEIDGESAPHFEHMNLDPRLYLDQIALVLVRDESRRIAGQRKRFEVAGLQANGSLSVRYDRLSVTCEDTREGEGGDDDQAQQDQDSFHQGFPSEIPAHPGSRRHGPPDQRCSAARSTASTMVAVDLRVAAPD